VRGRRRTTTGMVPATNKSTVRVPLANVILLYIGARSVWCIERRVQHEEQRSLYLAVFLLRSRFAFCRHGGSGSCPSRGILSLWNLKSRGKYATNNVRYAIIQWYHYHHTIICIQSTIPTDSETFSSSGYTPITFGLSWTLPGTIPIYYSLYPIGRYHPSAHPLSQRYHRTC
jgi:hypothetical protein